MIFKKKDSNKDLIIKHIITNKIKFVSFDIFDTLITRKTATPTGIFDNISNLLLDLTQIEIPFEVSSNFTEIRIKSEKKARRLSVNEEINLDEIYNVIENEYFLKHKVIEIIKNIEIDQEIDMLYSIEETRSIIEQLRKEGIKILFVSDMYLPHAIINTILKKNGLIQEEDNLFVSSCLRKTKHTGTLYSHILNELKIKKCEIIHIGDNYHSDYKVPNRMGIKSFYFNPVKLNYFERDLFLRKSDYNYLNNHIENTIGMSKITRNSYHSSNNKEKFLYETGCSFIGPIYLNFVIWVLKKAESDKIGSLYFLSRDGKIFWEIAKIISEKMGINIKLKYLYSSRRAFSFPLINSLNEQNLDILFKKLDKITINHIIQRLGIETDTIESEFGMLKIPFDKDLNTREISEIKEKIRNSKKIIHDLEICNKRKNELLFDYIKQEGFLDQKSALVDVGWTGTIQDGIFNLLLQNGHDNVHLVGYYFGLSQPTSISIKNIKKFYLFCNHLNYPYMLKNSSIINVVEMLCSNIEYSTIAFNKDEHTQKIIPVFEKNDKEFLNQWGISFLSCGIRDFTLNCSVKFLEELLSCNHLMKSLDFSRLKKYVELPDKETSKYMGDFPFSGDITHSNIVEIAPALDFKSFLRRLMGNYFFSYWIELSINRSAFLFKIITRIFLLKNHIVKSIKRRIKMISYLAN